MNALKAPTQAATLLAQLLERLDASRVPVDGHQYRTVVDSLTRMLSDDSVDWQPLLTESPAAAAVYENLHYAEAGLCRSPLEQAMTAEMHARAAIEAAARQAPAADSAFPDQAPTA